LITGAAGQIGYALAFLVARGAMFGDDQPIILHLLDLPFCLESLNGVVMELTDCAFPLLRDVVSTTEVQTAFTNIDYALLVGAFPRKEGMERKDLLKANANIFKEQGAALDKWASKNVKVVVVGNPANTNALLAMTHAPSLPRKNFSALTRLDHNRARAQVANRAAVPVTEVHNVFIWGNHSSTQYPDVNHGYIGDAKTPIRENLKEHDAWLNNEFISTVQQRGAAIIKARKLSSAASAAKAIVDHMHDWILGTPEGQWVSMAVASDGNSYGVPEDLIFSFPVTCKDGEWTIVNGLEVNEFSRGKLNLTVDELVKEKHDALSS